MKSLNISAKTPELRPLTAKELEVLWLYDCEFSDQKISKFLFLNELQIISIKNNLYKTLKADDIPSLIHSAVAHGYIHRV